jgi:site-specific DNA recombinase
LQEKKHLLDMTLKERTRLSKQVNTLVQLRAEGDVSKERFSEQYKPLEERILQLDLQLPELEAEIDVRTIQRLSSETVLEDAKVLSLEWATMPFEQKRSIVEIITSSIEIDKADISITLAYNPSFSQNGGNKQRNVSFAVNI